MQGLGGSPTAPPPHPQPCLHQSVSFHDCLRMKTASVRYFTFWSLGSFSSALYANRAILESYKVSQPDRLSNLSGCLGNVFIDETATVDPTAVVSILP